MKKILIIIISIFILVIGIAFFLNSNENYYQNIADITVGFFHSEKYDQKQIKDRDLEAIENFLSQLTHKNEIIDLSEYIIKEKEYYTSSHNTSGVFKKDGKCYIEYEDLEFDKPFQETETEPYKKVVCDNYFVDLYESQFYPEYEITKNNPKYDYYFDSSLKTDEGYEFTYYSTYDGSLLKVSLILEKKTITKVMVDFTYKGDN